LVPAAYIIPKQWTQLIELLHLHGVETETLDRDRQFSAVVTRLLDPVWEDRPYEGRHRVSFRIEHHDEPHAFAEGAVIVRMGQRAARVAMNLLEPEAPDSAVEWGMLDTIFEQKEPAPQYLLEPLAQSMEMQQDDLRMAYQKRLREDSLFAGDPKARLQWWYERSPYKEMDLYQYPVFTLAQAPVQSPAKKAEPVHRTQR
jgi:hypothetical protein